MTMRAAFGWQYAIADLALILFMITAAALDEAPREAGKVLAASPRAEAPAPTAVWGPGGTGVREWLTAQPRDPRQRLVLVAHYAGGEPGAPRKALQRAEAVLRTSGQDTRPVRVVVEPAGDDAVTAMLTWDAVAPSSIPFSSEVTP